VGEPITEFHMRIGFPESGCANDELGESWGVKIDLIEEGYIQDLELRG
jgi:hypothetical protein